MYTMFPRARRAALVFLFGLSASMGASAQERLPALGADPGRVSVSGLSSGGFMAVQYDVAFSASTIGAGIVAGGPYNCAYVNPGGMEACTHGRPSGLASFASARDLARAGQIDPVESIARHRIYLFSGTNDTTIVPRVVAAVRDQYAAAGVPGSRIAHIDTLPAGHGYLSARFGNRCGEAPAPPYVETCATATGAYDQPGAILAWICGALQPKPVALSSQPRAFYQREFGAPGFASTGYVYVPRQCERGAACAVHVVFHGCRQGAGAIGDAIYRRLGYNEWADSNGIIVLYPQVEPSMLPFNPEGCWDWWGYSGVDFQSRSGHQLAAVRAMVGRLTRSSGRKDNMLRARELREDQGTFWQTGWSELVPTPGRDRGGRDGGLLVVPKIRMAGPPSGHS